MTEHKWNYSYRLTSEDLEEIRKLFRSTVNLSNGDPAKWTYKRLMAEFHVGRDTIYRAIHGKHTTI